MNRPNRVKQVYVELKEALHERASDQEILECAALIVEVAEDQTRNTRCSVSTGRTSFVELPLDVLFSNWGWRLVCQEIKEDENYAVRQRAEDIVQRISGLAA